MSSRRRSIGDEIDFGSESFLDVIANIVGILIILIVVAGLRVKHAPPRIAAEELAVQSAGDAHWRQQVEEIETKNRTTKEIEQQAWRAYRTELTRRQEAAVAHAKMMAARADELSQRSAIAAKIRERQDQINSTAKQCENQVVALQSELSASKARASQATVFAVELKSKIETTVREATQLNSTLLHWSKEIERVNAESTKLQGDIADRRKNLAALAVDDRPARTWTHYSSPISMPLSKRELHFRVEGGKVDRVPLDDLIDRVRIELTLRDVRSETVLKGIAGPVDGFRLRYAFVAAQSSLTEIMASGSQRLQLVSFEVLPPVEDGRETVERALQADSKLVERLQQSPASQFAITLWVYPNGFGTLKKLQQRLHEEGYIVALRPLPTGFPIAGSPLGTASRGQ